MIYFPPAKINLGLKILGKRDDGFHELKSIFIPTNWCDVLEVVIVENGELGKLNFSCSSTELSEDNYSNTVVKAHELLSSRFNLPEINSRLLKKIPTGAGLGGGSSDGAFMLKAINELCELGLSNKKLKSLSSEIGSDCPFFIDSQASLVKGRGEIIAPLPFEISALNLNKLSIFIIYPAVHVSTGVAFALLDAGNLSEVNNDKNLQLEKLAHTPLNQWNEVIQNDFQTPISNNHPEIQDAIKLIEGTRAEYVQMTGSGSSVFGLYRTKNLDRSIIESENNKANKLGWKTYFGAL